MCKIIDNITYINIIRLEYLERAIRVEWAQMISLTFLFNINHIIKGVKQAIDILVLWCIKELETWWNQ